MATTKWRGDAQAFRQVQKVSVTNVGIGDVFTITCNRKVVSYTATEATASNVYSGLSALLGENATMAEFTEITPLLSYNGDIGGLWLQGPEDGTPFTVAVSKVNGSETGVSVETTTQGVAGANCQQTVEVTATGGTFTLTFLGQTTGSIDYNDSAADVETALEALSSIGSGNVAVSDGGTSGDTRRWIVEFIGTLRDATQPLLTGNGTSLTGIISGQVSEFQKGAPGTNHKMTLEISQDRPGILGFQFTNPFTSVESFANVSLTQLNNAAAIQAGLQSMFSLGAGNVTVTTTNMGHDFPGAPYVTYTYTIEFIGTFASTDMTGTLLETMSGSGPSASGPPYVFDDDFVVGSNSAVNEKQVLTFDAVPGGGTFTVTYAGQTTSVLAYNITQRWTP